MYLIVHVRAVTIQKDTGSRTNSKKHNLLPIKIIFYFWTPLTYLYKYCHEYIMIFLQNKTDGKTPYRNQYIIHALKHRPGGVGSNSRNDPGDYDILIVLVELHTLIYVRPLNEWHNPKLRHFEVENFGPKMTFIFGYNINFRAIGGIENF